MKNLRVTGIALIVIDLFIIYYRSDIIIELFNGRNINELEIYKLLLPLILLIVGIYLIIAKKKNEKTQ